MNLRYHDPYPGQIEGLLARGDRRVADVVEAAWRRGARFDGWDELFDYEAWTAAAAEVGVAIGWVCQRERPEHEVFPWDHIDSGLDKGWLWQDYRDAVEPISSASIAEVDDCRWTPCYDCGVCDGLDLVNQTAHAQPSQPHGRRSLPILSARPG